MAIGRSFPEALGKALRSMETKAAGFWTAAGPGRAEPDVRRPPHDGRIYGVERALRGGASVGRCTARIRHRPVVPRPDRGLIELRRARSTARAGARRAAAAPGEAVTGSPTGRSPRCGPEFAGEDGVRTLRHRLGDPPGLQDRRHLRRRVRGAHARTTTRAYETDPAAESEVAPQTERPKVLILGSGPNRIGQGIEFDYSCVHAALALREAGFETVMVNCNPETVSTDYDTSDRLYFEPLTFEDVLEVVHAEQSSRAPSPGVIVQLGGQTPLGLAAAARRRRACPSSAPRPAAIDLAEDRGAFGEVLRKAGLPGAGVRHGDLVRRRPARSPSGSATRCWSGRPTCSAGAAWRSSTTRSRSPTTSPGPPRSARIARCSSTGSSTTPSRSTSTRCATAPRSTSAA